MSNRDNRNKPVVGIYARVSDKRNQDPENQLNKLRDFCSRKGFEVRDEYIDQISTLKDNRPELNRILEDSRKGYLDKVIVVRLDRFGRSILNLRNNVEKLKKWDTDFLAVDQPFISLNDSMGRLFFNILSSIAEFERDLISDRTKEGMDRARKNGQELGRPKKIPREKALELRKEGLSYSEITKKLNDDLDLDLDKSSVYKAVKRAEEKKAQKKIKEC